MEERVYLTHRFRGEDFCPLCYASLVWRKVGDRKYTPCDKNPVMFVHNPQSRQRVVYRSEIQSRVSILTVENISDYIECINVKYGLRPHVDTCTGLGKGKTSCS